MHSVTAPPRQGPALRARRGGPDRIRNRSDTKPTDRIRNRIGYETLRARGGGRIGYEKARLPRWDKRGSRQTVRSGVLASGVLADRIPGGGEGPGRRREGRPPTPAGPTPTPQTGAHYHSPPPPHPHPKVLAMQSSHGQQQPSPHDRRPMRAHHLTRATRRGASATCRRRHTPVPCCGRAGLAGGPFPAWLSESEAVW